MPVMANEHREAVQTLAPPVGRAAAKVVLAVVSLMLLGSMGGGFLLLPALIPLHYWAAKTSGPVGRLLWSTLPAATAGMVAWALVYVAVRESQPAIWLVPLLATFLGALGMRRLLLRADRRETATP